MESAGPEFVRRFWLAAARSLTWRRNFAYWWDSYAPILIGVSAFAAVGLLIQRIFGQDTSWIWMGWAVGSGLAGVASAVGVWPKRMTLLEGLSCLDEIAKLHNRLVSAYSGVGEWPPVNSLSRDTARWNWRRLGIPVIGVAVLLLAASLAPRLELPRQKGTVEEPMAWSQVDSWLRTVEPAELADLQTLAELREQLAELRQKLSDEWYDHNTLEAGDALHQRLEQGLKEMRRALEQGSKALGALQQLDQTLSLSEMQGISNSLQQALQGLTAGGLPANQELQERLKKAGAGNLKQMTAEQLTDLQQRMNEGMKTVDRCVAPRIVEGKFGSGREGDGGTGGGGESQPVRLNDEATGLQSQRIETSINDEMSHALPGDLLAVTLGSQDVDRQARFQLQSGGRASSSGAGGDAVWRDSVTPEERQVLERYFK